MASGFGFHGGPSRCFEFWQDFRKCYVTAESAGDCMPQKDDYLECLHHTKEVSGFTLKQLARAHTIQEHTIKRQAEESRRAREEAKKGGVAGPRLGLIQIDSDDAKGDSTEDAKSS